MMRYLFKPCDLTVDDWRGLFVAFKAEVLKGKREFIAQRIEQTQFTIARYYGGIQINGQPFVYVRTRDGAEIIVRNDFIKFASDEWKKRHFQNIQKAEASQMKLDI